MRNRRLRIFIAGSLLLSPLPLPADGDRPMQQPAAVSFDRLTFHQPPKPLPRGAITSDWPHFLGPTYDCRSPETKLNHDWGPEGPPIVWEVTKGTGYTTPAVADGRLYLFHRLDAKPRADSGSETLECLDAETGKRYWRDDYAVSYTDDYGYNGGPRASPVIDGDHVYIYGVTSVLSCLNRLTGELIWRRNLAEEEALTPRFFGTGSTPLVHGDKLILNLGARGKCVVALDKMTGEEIWAAGEQWGASYASPIPATINGKERIVVLAGGKTRPPVGGLLVLDPENGNVAAREPFRARRYTSVNATSPIVFGGNKIFLSECYTPQGALLEMREAGEVNTLWRTPDFGIHIATPIYENGYIYGFDGYHPQDSQLVCFDAADGSEVWRRNLEIPLPGNRKRGVHRGTLLKVDGGYLCLGEYGPLLWVNLSNTGPAVESQTNLWSAPESWAHLALSRGLLYVAQNHRDMETGAQPRLVCYDLRAPAEEAEAED